MMGAGLKIMALMFLVPGLILALIAAFFLRNTRRLRAWIRITLLLTVLGTVMWTLTNRYMSIDLGSLQVGSMAAVVGIFSTVLALIAVWIMPRKKLLPPAPPSGPKNFDGKGKNI
jgi:hypothetical protein